MPGWRGPGADGFVTDHQLGLADQRTGQGNTLPLASGELTGVSIHGIPWKADAFQHVLGPCSGIFRGDASDPQRLGQGSPPDGLAGDSVTSWDPGTRPGAHCQWLVACRNWRA